MRTHIDTIVASATPPGRGGVAIIRVSGPLVKHISENILVKLPQPRYASYASFLDEEKQTVDAGIALFFPGPHSFTGEDILELHCHGGPAVVDRLIRRVITLGARLARPGEFSERAFLNNKIDLVQAEAIADLINAASEQAARSAIRSLQGEFSKKIIALVEALIRLRTYVEAAIDFAEEEINFLLDQQVANHLANILKDLEHIRTSATQGVLLQEGITAVIAGKPNVGKSTLLNSLSGRQAAIVTDIAGTTRDLLRESILIDGMPMHIIDTAGLHKSEDRVELEGIRRAQIEIDRADLVLWVLDSMEVPVLNMISEHIPAKTALIIIRNKIDLVQEVPRLEQHENGTIIFLSAKTGDGMELLRNHIKTCVGFQMTQEDVFSARQRHLDALTRAYSFLLSGQQQLLNFRAGELLAEDLRQAQKALDEITGQFSSDDLLGKIFESFCIGK